MITTATLAEKNRGLHSAAKPGKAATKRSADFRPLRGVNGQDLRSKPAHLYCERRSGLKSALLFALKNLRVPRRFLGIVLPKYWGRGGTRPYQLSVAALPLCEIRGS